MSKKVLLVSLAACAAAFAIAPTASADAGPYSYDGHEYWVTDGCLPGWQAAEDYAVALGGHLAAIKDSAENDFVRSIIGGGGGWWIGLTDRDTEGEWVWSSGEPTTYLNWNLPNEPNGGTGENCVEIGGGSGTWNDLPCDRCIQAVVEVAPPPACSDGGPYALDPYTLLLLHLDGSYVGAEGETPTDTAGTSFESGFFGQGVLVDALDRLHYPTAGNMELSQGTVEFWVKPNWDGNDGLHHIFFEVGDCFGCDRMRIQKDAANNLRFMLWDGGAEYGIHTGVAAWSAGEWHHVGVTWEAGQARLYVDGHLQASSATISLPNALTSTIEVGAACQWGEPSCPSSAYQPADAVIDEFRISNVARCVEFVNEPPTADAGPDQAIHAGTTVQLNGSASFDDNTPATDLLYAWSFTHLPPDSEAVLSGADTPTPSFVADLPDTYVVELVVTDEGALMSAPDEVVVSAENLPPTADAGEDQLAVTGNTVFLDGSASSDPEDDPLSFAWSIDAAPAGSAVVLTAPDTATPTLVPDLEGIYRMGLVVSDFIGPGWPDAVEITATTAEEFAEIKIEAAGDTVLELSPGEVTTRGNRQAFLNFLSQALLAIQESDLETARHKLERSIERADGCYLRGTPDGNGPGRDWITDCIAQLEVYWPLRDALEALEPLEP